MKRIVCELCDCMEFTKDGGMFICQGCGTKYTLEEAKAMMKEVEGDAPAVTTASAPAAGNQQIDNLLLLATNAYDADNYQEAESYCNRVIELDVSNFKAWFLKGRAIGWSSKINNVRFEEAAHSFCKALDFAPEEEKDSLKEQASEELKKLGIALIALRKQRFSGSPDTEELNGFNKDRLALINALTVLLSHGNFIGIPDGYLEEIASLMNQAGVAALTMAQTAWAKLDHPTDKDLSTYLDWVGNCAELFRQAIAVSDDDDEADIIRYKNLKIALEDPIEKYSQKYEWNSWTSSYEYVQSRSLTAEAKASRRKEMADCDAQIKVIESKIAAKKAKEAAQKEKERKARIEAYWAEHTEERDKLLARKKKLTDKKAEFTAELDAVSDTRAELENEKAQPTPTGAEVRKLRSQMNDLIIKRDGLGLFAIKEKKQINEELVLLEMKVREIDGTAQAEKKALCAEVDKKLAPVVEKISELEGAIYALDREIAAIDAELEKDRP